MGSLHDCLGDAGVSEALMVPCSVTSPSLPPIVDLLESTPKFWRRSNVKLVWFWCSSMVK